MTPKGQKMSAESRLKMSLAKKGKPSNRLGIKHTDETKRKISEKLKGRKPVMLGKHHTPETRMKISLAKLGKPSGATPFAGHSHTAETKEKIRLSLLGNKNSSGVIPSIETRKKMSESRRGNKNRLGKPHTEQTKRRIGEKSLGRKHTPETIAKMSEAHTGPKSNRWRGGGRNNYGQGWAQAKRLVRARDNNICVRCGCNTFEQRLPDVHHIVRHRICKLHGVYSNTLDNLAVLCSGCHRWADDHPELSVPFLRAILSDRFGYTYDSVEILALPTS